MRGGAVEVMDNETVSHSYELKYQNGDHYVPFGHPTGWRSFIVEEIESLKDTMRYRTSLVVEDRNRNRQTVYRCHMTEMSPGRIRSYGSEFSYLKGKGRTVVRNRMDFIGEGAFRSFVKKIMTNGKKVKVKKRERTGSVRDYQFVGMFHYTYLYNLNIREKLRNLDPGNTGQFRNLAFNSMEVNPVNGKVYYWKIVLKEIETEYGGGTDDPFLLYRLRFEAEPGFLTGLYFRIMNIKPEFRLWLTEDKNKICQIEEFNSSGKKVVYRMVP